MPGSGPDVGVEQLPQPEVLNQRRRPDEAALATTWSSSSKLT
jgi:hypothetical protein